jgi:proteasome lid subunit RPN8/RPN11
MQATSQGGERQLKPPTVLQGKERDILEAPPPPRKRWAPHKWVKEESLESLKEKEGKVIELFISKLAEEKMRNHSIAHAAERREVMGLMLGGFYRNEGNVYSIVRDVVTTDLEASSVRVRFNRGGFEQLFESLDGCGFDYIIVGWYHSHPGHGCFLSSTDIDTQKSLFSGRQHTALVLDPIAEEIRAFYLENGEVLERCFGVYWDDYQNPYYNRAVKMRKVRSNPDGMPSPEGGLGLSKTLHENRDESVEE